MDDMWKGANGLLLADYLEDKQLLAKKQEELNYLNYKNRDTSEHEEMIDKLQHKILEFISSLDTKRLKSIIYMSLNMEVEVGFPDKLNPNRRTVHLGGNRYGY